jgi:hypothetical protein
VARRTGNPSHRGLPPWLILTALLGACQPQPQPGSEVSARPEPSTGWPAFDYAAPAAAGQDVFRLDPRASLVEVVVRRDGPLARFGHDHVITVHDPEGFLLLGEANTGSHADLRFRLDQLEVDSAAGRQRYGLDTNPDAADIAATRKNLMEHVLNPEDWPWATIGLTGFERQADHYSAVATFSINGSEYNDRQPFSLHEAGGRVTIEGYFIVRQTELGIEPFSALGGGLRVADPLEVHFRLVAVRVDFLPLPALPAVRLRSRPSSIG